MPFKIYYNEYPPSIGNSKEEENPEPLTYDYELDWELIPSISECRRNIKNSV